MEISERIIAEGDRPTLALLPEHVEPLLWHDVQFVLEKGFWIWVTDRPSDSEPVNSARIVWDEG